MVVKSQVSQVAKNVAASTTTDKATEQRPAEPVTIYAKF